MPLKDWSDLDYSLEYEKGSLNLRELKVLMEQLGKNEVRFTVHSWKAQGGLLGKSITSIGHTVFPSIDDVETVHFITIDYLTRTKEITKDAIIQQTGLVKSDGSVDFPKNLRDA